MIISLPSSHTCTHLLFFSIPLFSALPFFAFPPTQSYLDQHKYGNAETHELWEALQTMVCLYDTLCTHGGNLEGICKEEAVFALTFSNNAYMCIHPGSNWYYNSYRDHGHMDQANGVPCLHCQPDSKHFNSDKVLNC